MIPIFVDTSALIALGNKRDNFHHQAHAIRQALTTSQQTFITTSLVTVELCNTFSGIKLRTTATTILESIQRSKRWTYFHVDRRLMERGLERFKKMQDKEWSLVDCVSMLVATDTGCKEVFTNDHHFKQAGFTILLNNPAP